VIWDTATVIAGGVGYRLVASGQLTLDTGFGRRVRALSPLTRVIAAPREIVFDVISSPYLGRTPRATAGRLSDRCNASPTGTSGTLA
jgi:hypothetical protein